MDIKSVKNFKENHYEVKVNDSSLIHYVPNNELNSDYQKIQEWVAEGNTIEEAD